ncbi:molybdenum ABC transporter ATP-binding protein [Prosthecomicrobium pneumaticum]|uniref:Molybdate transport system ATP-binding protein n=1 Tax=Prosthecomicrobium pneumaticum TaxID=81895 RepID=A0A7W9FPF3_9HYPH|nr:molybdenum ABC transporter ATP-binding protein [Prosthecomicrobium pneumaticum]MBB5754452.1 molybdate transport system ATP-binding protein [Prosthecomicrobium pneumaticum]
MTIEVAIEKRLGAFALDVAFSAGDGVTALFGRSGAGKTSIVKLIAGLAPPDRGTIRLGGTTLVDTAAGVLVPPHRRAIGMVFQEARLFPHLSVRRNLLYGRWLARGRAPIASLETVVDLLGLSALLNRRPRDLSGGEQQRVAIGRALLCAPRLLLMDEPLASLDRTRRAEILPYLEGLSARFRLPIVYVSHQIEEVARLADRVVLIEAGRVAGIGPVETVFGQAESRDDFDAATVLTATLGRASGADGPARLDHPAGPILVSRLDRPVGSAVRLRIRARDVALAVGEPGRLSIRNRLKAVVVAIEVQRSGDRLVRLDAGGAPLVAQITADAAEDLALEPGMPVVALVKAVAIDGLAFSGATD